MDKSFKNIQNGFQKVLPGLWNFIKGFFYLLIWESIIGLIVVIKKRWQEAKSDIDRVSIILTSFVIVGFIIYGIYGLYIDLYIIKTKEWRESIIINNSQKEIESFFRKYNERFLAHDCEFMATVGADESMHDKWGHDKYENYKCEEFVRFQSKLIIPVKIHPIERFGGKLRAKGEAVVIYQNQGEPWLIKTMYFDLWKLETWDLWHFNNPKEGPRIIESKITLK